MGRALQPHDRISHYRIVSALGAGGMGEVYVAQDESLDRNVALKVLPAGLVRNEERVRRFIREAKSASSLNHPNIVTIYEIGNDPIHFISMELVSGDTLSRKIHGEKADLRTLVGYLAQASEGIAKAHAAGIVHRDLKPGNIMVSRDGFAKVLDFGLAKLTEREATSAEAMSSAPTKEAETSEGIVLGTVGYMSPEQVQAKATDARSDIFAMGCILYEAATRRRPFTADTDVEVMHRILRDTPAPVEELNPAVPVELRRLIHRCLAKNPDQRFQSMKDLALDLREVAEAWDSLPSGAAVLQPRTTSRRVTRAAATLGLAVVAAALYFLWGRAGSKSMDAPTASMKLSTLMSRDDLGDAVLSRDGRYLAYAVTEGDRSSLNVRQVRTGSDVRILPPQELAIHGISFSPDGDYLYFLNRDPEQPDYRALFQVASLGGAPRKVAFDVDTAVSFSPDAKRVCFKRGRPNEHSEDLVIRSLETGEERTLLRVKDPESFTSPYSSGAPAWSPDGRRIAAPIFSAVSGSRTVVTTIDVETGKREDLSSHAFLFVNALDWLPDGTSIVMSASDPGAQIQIHRLSYPGGEASRITSDLDGYEGLSVSADGRLLAAVRRTGIANVWVARSGEEPKPLTFATGGGASVKVMTPVDDGGTAFTAAQGERFFIWRIESGGSDRRKLTMSGDYVINLAFAPGAGIVFTQVDATQSLHVWRVDAKGGNLRQLTQGAGEGLSALSPDGRSVLFRKLEDSTRVWKCGPAGEEPSLLLTNVGGQEPTFSPDGRRLLFASLEETEGRLYPRHFVIPADGGEPLASFRLPPGAEEPRLAPEGDALTYVDRANHFNLMRRSIGQDDARPLTHFREGRIHGHEWSPDGKRILMQRRVAAHDSLWVLEPGPGKPPRMLTEFKTGKIGAYAWDRESKGAVFTYGSSSQDVVLISDFR